MDDFWIAITVQVIGFAVLLGWLKAKSENSESNLCEHKQDNEKDFRERNEFCRDERKDIKRRIENLEKNGRDKNV